jgi:hypothetical protein
MSLLGTSYDWRAFNALPEVEVADEAMRALDKLSVAVSVLAPVFAQYGVCDTWGLSLLHKHWLLEDGEQPVQEVRFKGSAREFVTRPRSLDVAVRHLPSIMGVTSDRRLHAIEFSTDPQVAAAHDVLRTKPAFAAAFCRLVATNDLRDTFGLIANKAIEEEDGLVEFNYVGRISVLRRETPADPQEGRYIQTSWRFVEDASGIACHFRCVTRCRSGAERHEPIHPPDHGVDT